MRGLDPRIHRSSQEFSKRMDCRVKPGNDECGIIRLKMQAGVPRKHPGASRRSIPSRAARGIGKPRTHCAARPRKLGCLKIESRFSERTHRVGWAKPADANASGGVPTIQPRIRPRSRWWARREGAPLPTLRLLELQLPRV